MNQPHGPGDPGRSGDGDGGQTQVVPRGLHGERLDRVVSMGWAVPRSQAAELVGSGAVHVDGVAVTTRSARVAEGQAVTVELSPSVNPVLVADSGVAFGVVHADAHVVVVDKPPGLVVHPGAGRTTGTLVQGLLARYPDIAGVGADPMRPGIVHRLDAGTSGLLVVARTPDAYRSLVSQLRRRTVQRHYLALVWGTVATASGLVDAPVGRADADRTRMAVSARGREARTRYEVRERFTDPAEVTLVECSLETGRTHQIRVHLAAIGHPVVGDARYRGQRPPLAADRPFLHAHRLGFDHPATGERSQFHVPLPDDLVALHERLS